MTKPKLPEVASGGMLYKKRFKMPLRWRIKNLFKRPPTTICITPMTRKDWIDSVIKQKEDK